LRSNSRRAPEFRIKERAHGKKWRTQKNVVPFPLPVFFDKLDDGGYYEKNMFIPFDYAQYRAAVFLRVNAAGRD
jgi:hypothetical protein